MISGSPFPETSCKCCPLPYLNICEKKPKNNNNKRPCNRATDRASVSCHEADLLQLTDLIIEVINAPLVLQAELGEQICAQLGLQ